MMMSTTKQKQLERNAANKGKAGTIDHNQEEARPVTELMHAWVRLVSVRQIKLK
jgi:hypothetical protein